MANLPAQKCSKCIASQCIDGFEDQLVAMHGLCALCRRCGGGVGADLLALLLLGI